MTDAPHIPPEQAETRIREELEKAASLISGARRLMSEGRTVELGALEERMRAVTSTVKAAPEEIAHGYKDHLQALMDALDALEHDLKRQHQALEAGLESIRRREAQGAYRAHPTFSPMSAPSNGTPPNTTPPGPDEPDEEGP